MDVCCSFPAASLLQVSTAGALSVSHMLATSCPELPVAWLRRRLLAHSRSVSLPFRAADVLLAGFQPSTHAHCATSSLSCVCALSRHCAMTLATVSHFQLPMQDGRCAAAKLLWKQRKAQGKNAAQRRLVAPGGAQALLRRLQGPVDTFCRHM